MNDQTTSSAESNERTTHVNEHVCLDLLQGLLSHEEEERVFSHLATCPVCEKVFQERAAEGARLEATRVLRTGPGGELSIERRGTAARSREAERSDHRGWNPLSQLLTSIAAGFRMPRFQLAGGIAAAAVVVVAAWFYYERTPAGPNLEMLHPYAFQLQTRDAGRVAGEDLRAGLKAYDREDFQRAEELLNRAGVPELGEMHELIRKIYLGSTLAMQGKHRDAVNILEHVSFASMPNPWGIEAMWTFYVALGESGHEARADSLLQILATKPGAIGDRARNLSQPQDGD